MLAAFALVAPWLCAGGVAAIALYFGPAIFWAAITAPDGLGEEQ